LRFPPNNPLKLVPGPERPLRWSRDASGALQRWSAEELGKSWDNPWENRDLTITAWWFGTISWVAQPPIRLRMDISWDNPWEDVHDFT